MIKPIKPSEVVAAKAIPDFVVDVFNKLIARDFDGNESKIRQREVITLLSSDYGVSREQVFQKGFLNIESLFTAAGWEVDYDRPGYNEDYDAFFIFTKK